MIEVVVFVLGALLAYGLWLDVKRGRTGVGYMPKHIGLPKPRRTPQDQIRHLQELERRSELPESLADPFEG